MSSLTVNNYINKKFNDITKDSLVMKAYNLGMAVGTLELYKSIKRDLGQKEADKIFKSILDGKEEFNTIFRTLVGLYNEESKSNAEKLYEKYKYLLDKKPEILKDEERDFLEEFMEFLYKKGDN